MGRKREGNALFLYPSHTRIQVDPGVSGRGARRDEEGGPGLCLLSAVYRWVREKSARSKWLEDGVSPWLCSFCLLISFVYLVRYTV